MSVVPPYLPNLKTGPCPACNKLTPVKKDRCQHCDHQMSETQRDQLRKYADAQFRKGAKYGIIFFSAAIVAFALAQCQVS